MTKMVTQYRLVVWRKPGKWRFDKETVIDEAIELGVARKSQRHRNQIYWDIMVEIQQRLVPAEKVIVKLGRAA